METSLKQAKWDTKKEHQENVTKNNFSPLSPLSTTQSIPFSPHIFTKKHPGKQEMLRELVIENPKTESFVLKCFS